MAPSHYPNQCWNIVNWTLGNKLHWNFNWHSDIFTEENTFENVVCQMLFISSRPQCVNPHPVLIKLSEWRPFYNFVLPCSSHHTKWDQQQGPEVFVRNFIQQHVEWYKNILTRINIVTYDKLNFQMHFVDRRLFQFKIYFDSSFTEEYHIQLPDKN